MFVGTRVAEIQTLIDTKSWRYVDSKNKPSYDLTRGKTLLELSQHNRWSQGPAFLLLAPDCWPANPCLSATAEPVEELRKAMFCGMSSVWCQVRQTALTWESIAAGRNLWRRPRLCLMEKRIKVQMQGFINAERHILQRAQSESLPEEFNALKDDQLISKSSKLLPLAIKGHTYLRPVSRLIPLPEMDTWQVFAAQIPGKLSQKSIYSLHQPSSPEGAATVSIGLHPLPGTPPWMNAMPCVWWNINVSNECCNMLMFRCICFWGYLLFPSFVLTWP